MAGDRDDDQDDDEAKPWSIADELYERGGWVDPDPTADNRAELVNDLQAILDVAKEQAKWFEQHAIDSIAAACHRLGKQVFDQLRDAGRAINAQASVIDAVREEFRQLKAGPAETGHELPVWAAAFQERLLRRAGEMWNTGAEQFVQQFQLQLNALGISLGERVQQAVDLAGECVEAQKGYGRALSAALDTLGSLNDDALEMRKELIDLRATAERQQREIDQLKAAQQ